MEKSFDINVRESADTIVLQAIIPDTIEDAPLSKINAYMKRSLIVYVVKEWEHVKQRWFVGYVIVKGKQRLEYKLFNVDDMGRMCGLED